jgi:hypothetical protein
LKNGFMIGCSNARRHQRPAFLAMRTYCGAVVLLLAGGTALAADTDPLHAHPWKLTVGEYLYSGYSGTDVNLRWKDQDTDIWVGVYKDRDFGTQTRTGIDTTVTIIRLVQLQPSLQLASSGFVGGSLNLQVGDAWFVFGGIGRTNLKPYFNLNFDPNDAITLGAGHRSSTGDLYSMFLVADDRLHTQQRDWHVNARLGVRDMRATVDILHKTGLGDAGPVSAWGFSFTWDFPRWFVRVARDPQQNFSAQDAWRLAVGARF